jgi:hypothetical protein
VLIEKEREKERIIEEKERIIEEKERIIDEKQKVIEGKERIIEGKDDMIVGLRESSDIAKALTDVQKPKPVQKMGERIHVFRFLTCHDILQAQ